MLLTRDNLPETIPDIAALDDLLCRPSQALIDDLAKVDGDIMILGVAGKMGPTLAGLAKAALPGRRVIGVARFSDPEREGVAGGPRHRDLNCDLLDEAAIKALPKVQEHHLHGRPQVRRRGRPVADLGDECPRPCAGGAGLSELADRGVLDRLRLSVRAGRRQGRRRKPFAQSARRIRAILRRARAHVRIFLAQVLDAGPAVPAQLRDRHALRRAARHREQRSCRASRSTSASAMSISSGRAMPRHRRCAVSRIATRRPRRSMSAATKSWPCAISPPNSARGSGARPSSSAPNSRPPGSPTPRRPRNCSACRSSIPQQLIAWTADWVARAMPSLGKPTKYEVRDGRY